MLWIQTQLAAILTKFILFFVTLDLSPFLRDLFHLFEMQNTNDCFLPPVSEGWGRYCFHRCLSVHMGRGYPSPSIFTRSLVPDSLRGEPQSQVLSKVAGPGSFLGATPVLLRGPGMRYPPIRTRVPLSTRIGLEYPLARSEWGTPQGQGQAQGQVHKVLCHISCRQCIESDTPP